MNVRTATVLEVDQDVQTARNAARGILAAASNLRAADAADAGDLPVRVKRVAAIAAEHAEAVDRDSAARRAPAWHRRAARAWRRGREHRRNYRHLLRAWPRLRRRPR